ncbi:hypothetical protein CTEN210_00658 [Chaetoceros tenuissimus]|uniref:Enoyl reductase (ER) domain-containing protein n=1 Tax=Chaetoceros tenuissimus TaxID=426638 RepID=A0AAD3CEJ4_9STRA|nr:hypothetical protein CTEN210_00658 [Chaetoceros tenuissimus]
MLTNVPMKAYIREGNPVAHLAFTNRAQKPLLDVEGKDKRKVLVKVISASINPLDYKGPRLVVGNLVGIDFCGMVTEVGRDASVKFKVGDLVYGNNMGTLAEFISVPMNQMAKAPKNWEPHELGCVAVAYLAPLAALKEGKVLDSEYKKVKYKNSILVIGASGGTGIATLQLAKALGFTRIVAICSSRNESFVRDNGATEVVDYTHEKQLMHFYGENFGTFDMVLDCATNSGHGEDYWDKSVQLLNPTGNYIALNGPPSKWMRYFLGIQKSNAKVLLVLFKKTSKDLEKIIEILNQTGARPKTTRFAFDEKGIESGFKLLKSRRAKGKIVFDIAS